MDMNSQQLDRSMPLVLAANFTADPIGPGLDFWAGALPLWSGATFAPFDQVFQQLLDPTSMLNSNTAGINALLVQTQRWGRGDELMGKAQEFVQAVQTSRGSGVQSPLLVMLCPPLDDQSADPAQQLIAASLAAVGGVEVMTSEQLLALYPVSDLADPQGLRLADIPYSEEFFCALSAILARAVWGVSQPPKKVLVLDCDDTLWGGLCAELGPEGVTVSAHHLALQDHALRCRQAGMLITLASKNNEADVLAVFERNGQMRLKLDDIASHRINWNLKSESLSQLSEELGLGLDSMIFVDDDGLQLAEVQRRHPQVMAFAAPQENAEQFWQHFWATDVRVVTDESARRTDAYREQAARQQLQEQTLSQGMTLADFIQSLDLKVELAELTEQDLARAHELSQRTNQFNLNGLRQTEAHLQALMANPGASCLTARVKDRFGDYGLVGFIQALVAGGELRVQEFLLSCRALGRGVEHQMLAAVGELAQGQGIGEVVIEFTSTQRNLPARSFLQSLTSVGVDANGDSANDPGDIPGNELRMTASAAAAVRFAPDVEASRSSDITASSTPIQSAPAAPAGSDFLLTVAADLTTAQTIHGAIFPQAQVGSLAPGPTDSDPMEQQIKDAFCKHLGLDAVDINDGFFELGGHSLQAVQILAEISAEAGVELDPTLLFTTSFSVQELTEEIGFLKTEQSQGMGGVLDQLSALTDG